jgi:hypothetical protein
MILGLSVVGLQSLDPAYRTESYIPATIVKKVYGTSKSGSHVEVYVETSEGVSYWFIKGVRYTQNVGDRVKLRVYKREITGLERLELE